MMCNAWDLSAYQATILCEDQTQYRLAREFLKLGKVSERKIYDRIAPPGSGSGKAWVLKHVAQEVTELRRRASRTLLLIVIDADEQETEAACREIRCRYEALQLPEHNPVIAIVPKRNVESWLHFLLRGEIDEERSFKRLYMKQLSYRDQAAKLVQVVRSVAQDDLPPSLAMARQAWLQSGLFSHH
ncbi:MAG: hypothetical protein HQM06_09480 [Magnetococcales bacterium]|nr:hypothetical protein [Magnetococcales bacterium]